MPINIAIETDENQLGNAGSQLWRHSVRILMALRGIRSSLLENFPAGLEHSNSRFESIRYANRFESIRLVKKIGLSIH